MTKQCTIEIVDLTGTPNDEEPEQIQWTLRLSRYPLKEWRTCWKKEREVPTGTPVPDLHGNELIVRCTKDDLKKSLEHYREWVEKANECCREQLEEKDEDWRRNQRKLMESRAIIEEAREEIEL